MLDVKSTNQGFLMPRVSLLSTTDVISISSPATSLLVYNTATISDVVPGFYYFNGTIWVRFLNLVSLDMAYDYTGSGGGRAITADNGVVAVNGTDGFAVTGTFGSRASVGAANAIPSGAGSRMFYYPKKSAFRAGIVTGTEWDDGNIGNYSVALGRNVTASNSFSFAAAGGIASGVQSVCLASKEASGDLSVAIGASSEATGFGAIAIGGNLASSSAFESALGYYNTLYTPSSTVNPIGTDRLLVVGNGSNSARSNALTLWKSGRMQLGGDETSSNARRGKFTILGAVGSATVGSYNFINNSINSVQTGASPTGTLSLYADGAIAGSQIWAHSDARIKENITSTDSKDDLSLLMNVQIRDYTFKDKLAYGFGTQKKVIAQELRAIYPQAVDATGTKMLPNIMKHSTIEEGWVALANHKLQKGDRIRLALESGQVQKTLQ